MLDPSYGGNAHYNLSALAGTALDYKFSAQKQHASLHILQSDARAACPAWYEPSTRGWEMAPNVTLDCLCLWA